ncbi:acyl-CoA dehydrogenase family protein [Caulobacter sp. LARHSG274]
MSESLSLLSETADRLFADLGQTSDATFADLWPQIEEAGFPALLVAEDDGGFGGDWQDAFAVLRLAGVHALNLPLAEAILAAKATAAAGLPAIDGFTTLATSIEGSATGGRFAGVLRGVAAGAEAVAAVVRLDGQLLRLRIADAAAIRPGRNPAGEGRDVLVFDGAPVEQAVSTLDLFALGALARTAQIAGALDAALALSIQHANDRVQFGKPIAKFQAVQQSLAVFALEAAAVNCAGQAAARAADHAADGAGLEIAAAKLRANVAAGAGAAIAHQAHGAIGFTREHPLHRLTLRLTAWRSEFGNDRVWAERLGALVAAEGADGLWPMLTRRSDAA